MDAAQPPARPAVPPPDRKFRDRLGPFGFPLVVVGLHFASFSLARLAILAFHAGEFSSLSGGDVTRALVRGLRFDAGAIFPVIGLPLFLLLLPIGGSWGTRGRVILGWLCYALLAGFLLILGADAVYFGIVHRHAGLEVTEPGGVFKTIALSVASHDVLPVLGYLTLLIGLFFFWKRLLRREPRPWSRPAAQIAAALFAAILLYFGERGTFSGKRLRVVHAFQNAPLAAAHLSLNGPYCILHSLVHSRAVRTEFYPWADAIRTARESILTPGETVVDPEYPMLRSRPARDTGTPNVVVILLESWDASATDAHRRELGLAPLGCTPSYDAVAKEGLLFSRFYASGQRSMDGLSATLCGFPSIPGTPYLGRGLEQSTLTSLGRLARKEGYDTWFIMSAERDAFRIDAIAGLTGFEHYLGAEDIPPAAPVEPRAVLRGPCWDHEMFAEANRKLAAAKRPFLAYLYTSSTHHPFFWPGQRWSRRPSDSLENRYLNSLEYGDWALGEFFRSAKESGWYDRTLFIVTSDHIGGPGYGLRKDEPATYHHVPGLILAPGLRPGVDRRIAGQLDVIPTIADLAGWGSPQAALGTSLLSDPVPGRGALCVQGNLVLRVEEGGFVLHSLGDRVLGSSLPGNDPSGIERRLLSGMQVAYTLLRTNRLSHGD